MNRSLIFILLLICSSCQKGKLADSLPEITNNGQHTLGFFVEEKAWVPQWEKYTWGESCKELSADFLSFDSQFELFGGIKINGKKSYFNIHIDSLNGTGSYTSNATISINDSNGLFIRGGGSYNNTCGPDASISLTINRFDTAGKIVSGTFQARLRKMVITNIDMQDIYPNSPQFIVITDGRFDVRYHYCR